MCWNFEISLLTGIFSWNAAYLLLKKPQPQRIKKKIYFLIIFSSIQFADAILWFIDVKRNNINYITTSFIIPSILAAQILFNIYYSNNYKNTNIILNIIIILVIIYPFYIFNGYTVKENHPIYGCNLVWANRKLKFSEAVTFIMLFFVPFSKMNTFILLLKENIAQIIIFVGLLLVNRDGITSVWCSLANILSLELLIKYY